MCMLLSVGIIMTAIWMYVSASEKPVLSGSADFSRPDMLSMIFFERTCDIKKTALPMIMKCPDQALITDIAPYTLTKSINSPDVGYANIRSDGDFSEVYTGNILAVLADKQQFCSYGPVKPYYDPRGYHVEDAKYKADTPAGLAYRVLLKDSMGKYCRGYVIDRLVNTL